MVELLFRARERGLLLLLALILLIPVGGVLYLTVSESPQIRLVEARPKLVLSQTAASLPPPVAPALTVTAARTDNAEKVASAPLQPATVRKPTTSALLPQESSATPTVAPNLAFETSLLTSRLTTPVQPLPAASPVNIVKPTPASNTFIGSLAPSPSLESTQLSASTLVAIEAQQQMNSASPVGRAEPQLQSADKSKPTVQSAVGIAAMPPQAKPTTAETRVPSQSTVGTPVAYQLRPVDVEDVLTRFSSAYESGSLSAFEQVLAPGLPGRTQLLVEYGRVFQQTLNRSIRFVQLKHAATGDRIATRGYAVVTTTDQENRTSKQRVYLELEIGIDRNVPRIERISNYVIH